VLENKLKNTVIKHCNNYYKDNQKHYTNLYISIIKNILYLYIVINSNNYPTVNLLVFISIKSTIMKAIIHQHQSLIHTASLLFSAYMVVLVVLVALFS